MLSTLAGIRWPRWHLAVSCVRLCRQRLPPSAEEEVWPQATARCWRKSQEEVRPVTEELLSGWTLCCCIFIGVEDFAVESQEKVTTCLPEGPSTFFSTWPLLQI